MYGEIGFTVLSAMDDRAQLFPAIACFRLPLSTRSRYYLIRQL